MFVNNDSNPVALSISLVKALLKMVGFAPAAAMLEGGQDLYQLLTDISNGSLGDPNAEMIRSLNSVMHAEIDRIEADLKNDGVDRTQVKQILTTLLDATKSTIKNLSADESKLLEAIRKPDSFADLVKHEAVALPKDSDENTQSFYGRLLEVVAAEFLTLTPGSPNFNRVALVDLIRCFPDWRDRIDRLEQSMNKRFDKVDEDNQEIIGLLREQSSSVGRLFFGSRPDVVAAERFVERDEHKQLKALITDLTRQRTVLSGMRGCGKTQLAASLAKQCEDANWDLVAWINAISPESIKSELVELAKQLGIGTSDQLTQDQVIRSFLSRMKSAKPADRLIIFDNVEDINHLRGLIPSGDGVRVVATTTNDKGWNYQGWDDIRIEVFDREKSINYLLTETESADRAAADTLAYRLGDLPLALAQAAAFAQKRKLDLAQYLERLDAYRSGRVMPAIPGDYYAIDVATALRVAIDDTLKELEVGMSRAARRHLGVLALLAESGVPTRWIDPLTEEHHYQDPQDRDRAADDNAHDALTELIDRSIIQQSADGSTTMLHRLQAQVLRESWSEEERKQACESAATLLESVDIEGFPRDATASLRKETRDLIEQLRALGTQKESHPLFDTEQIRSCLMRAFVDANELGLTDEALTLQHGVEIIQSLVGSAHSDVLALQNNLATAYEKAGRLNEAIALFEQVLSDRIRILGDKHPDTLASRNNLAGAYLAANRPEESIALYEQVLTDRIGILSDDHPDTLASRNNLAYAYQSIGCFTEAISQLQQVLADSTGLLGEDHPQTLTARNNLAYAYVSAGNFTIATPVFEQILADSIQILGEDHPHTLTSRNNLAYAYQEEGRLTEAIDLYEQVSANSIRVLGSVHPETLSSLNNLACAYAAAGRITEAITQFEQVLTDCTRVLDEDYPLTKTVRENLEATKHKLKQQKAKPVTK